MHTLSYLLPFSILFAIFLFLATMMLLPLPQLHLPHQLQQQQRQRPQPRTYALVAVVALVVLLIVTISSGGSSGCGGMLLQERTISLQQNVYYRLIQLSVQFLTNQNPGDIMNNHIDTNSTTTSIPINKNNSNNINININNYVSKDHDYSRLLPEKQVAIQFSNKTLYTTQQRLQPNVIIVQVLSSSPSPSLITHYYQNLA